DNIVLEAVVEQTTRERAATAVKLRDAGKIDEARALFKQNAAEISAFSAVALAPSARLQQMGQEYDKFAEPAVASSPAQWNASRKNLRALDATSAGEKRRFLFTDPRPLAGPGCSRPASRRPRRAAPPTSPT